MSFLGNPQEIFDINDSNNSIGSFYTKEDISKILKLSQQNLNNLPFEKINNKQVIDENILQKYYYKNKLNGFKKERNVSFDELVLKYLIKQTYPSVNIIQQFKIGRYRIDLYVKYNDNNFLIEFDSPYHFITNHWGRPNHPFRKKNIIEEKTNYNIINWPYWIHKCTRNIKILLEQNFTRNGIMAIWSSKIHFGDFIFDDSASIIKKMNKQFNIYDENGIGYVYVNHPIHPIIKKIKQNKKDINILIPKDYNSKKYWIPDVLYEKKK